MPLFIHYSYHFIDYLINSLPTFCLNYSYFNFTKSHPLPVFWASFDINKFSVEARYNYEWEENISLYFGAVLKHNDWNFRLMQGVAAGDGRVGLSISTLSIYDGRKILIYNNPQVIYSIKNLPTYFIHWGEIYYKATDFFWFGLSDRTHRHPDEDESKYISFGSQVSFVYKNFFLNIYYWWPPTWLTENRFTVMLGYQRSFTRHKKK